jgi:hypothetical protein
MSLRHSTITLNYHPAGSVVIKVLDHLHGVLGACICGGIVASRLDGVLSGAVLHRSILLVSWFARGL